MSGAYAINRLHEFDFELREDEEQKARRAVVLRAIYALVDPAGWDARRLRERPVEEVA